MRRDLSMMSGRRFDLIVVGGGVTGACVARDAALRGLAVALVEKHDFSHATSAASSKLIHGGLRYLRNLEFGLIRESLRERRIWERSAPHLVYPLAMVMPVYARHDDGLAKMRLGLSLYDALAFDRGWLADPDQRIPAHRSLSPAETLALQPELAADGLTGALQYFDCQMFSPERLALECLISAAAAGAALANYVEVDGFVREGPRVAGVRVRDRIGGATVELRAGLVINAAGPWADKLLERVTEHPPPMMRSKGIHVITRPLTSGHALAIVGAHGHVFVLPWRGHSLIGTTDEVYEGEPDAFRVTERDIAGLLNALNAEVPAFALTRGDVLHTYGGLRPLVEDSSATSSYDASRRSEICDHAAQGGPEGLVSVLGGKWTTSRRLAEKVVDMVGRKLGRKLAACPTAQTPVPGGAIGRFASFVAGAVHARPGLDAGLVQHLARNYGARMDEVLHLVRHDPGLARPLADGLPEVAAQVVHAVRAEMAVGLEDVVFRRTGLGTLGNPGEAALTAVAGQMGALLGWDRAERVAQVDRVLDRYVVAGA
ncbi:MAG: glycerol-3-phosphate dehydrogenase/oxidase [Myxococcales bacterium]|nr:glycerol-3-phosphate dehydrogenase/oxidase [Myxococcales bacterium]